MGNRPANVTLLGSFSNSKPLMLPRCGYSDFRLHHIAPILPVSKMAFLGSGRRFLCVPGVIRERMSHLGSNLLWHLT